jgi:hypothetical protein
LDTGSCTARDAFFPDIIIEAEKGKIVSPMQLGASASGDSYVYTATGMQGSASYAFSITRPGRYIMAIRALSADGGENSYFIGLDTEAAQGNDYYQYNMPISQAFAWSNVTRWGNGISSAEFNPMVWDLAAGTHTFTIYGRETNTLLDAITLKSICHEADTDCDGCIEQAELMQYIQLWKSGQATLTNLMEAIRLWKQGC